jgi:ubiquinone/menaquinone biosynthesis C-methylase UbiE
MAPSAERKQRDLVRERFTRTAQQFAKFSLATRAEEAARLVALAAPRGTERALDLACGPGTFTRAFAPRVKSLVGLDLTPALLDEARAASAAANLANLSFALGDASALPLANASFDLVICAYSFHHFAEAERVVAELARVTRVGGRAAIADLIVPDDRAAADLNNRIERARDASHTRTLAAGELCALLEAAGFAVGASEIGERPRSFDDWMRIAGWEPGDPAYAETRRLMESSIAGDAAGFHPRVAETADSAGRRDITYVQTSLFVIADRL